MTHVDVVLFGGGAAGLWLLAELTRQGHSALLLESRALGTGQTISSQGILHGGLKYTLQGLLTPAARQVREMPSVWRDCLAGTGPLDLQRTRVRSPHCFLWQTASWSSQLGMLGARIGLQVRPESLAVADRPALLADCPGTVAKLPEQVISPASFLADLSRQLSDRILLIDPARVDFRRTSVQDSIEIRLSLLEHGELSLLPKSIVLSAGAGNAGLREQLGLAANAMQRRPLHMVLARGTLPEFNGHCVDGAQTRVTITSDEDREGRVVWQIGGQVSEAGAKLSARELIQHTQRELLAVLPGVKLDSMEWSTYRVDRAEGVTATGGRPDTVQLRRDGNVFTVWPTKLVLAPQLAHEVINVLPAATNRGLAELGAPLSGWPRPPVACPPWDDPATAWMT